MVVGGSGQGADKSELVKEDPAWERWDDEAADEERTTGGADSRFGSTEPAGATWRSPKAWRPVGELTNWRVEAINDASDSLSEGEGEGGISQDIGGNFGFVTCFSE